jgi:hypothetical protein
MLTVDDSLLIAMAEQIRSVYGLIVFALFMVIISSIVQVVTSIIQTMRHPASAGEIARAVLDAPLVPSGAKQVNIVEEDIYKQYMGSPDIEKAIPTIVEDRR